MSYFGWRAVFQIFGLVGIVWAGVWYYWYRDWPERHRAVSQSELNELALERTDNANAAHERVPWKQLLASRQLWIIMAMYSFYVWGSMFYLTWFPEYLLKGRGLSEAQMGLFTALPFLLGAAGSLLGGFLTDWLSLRYGLNVGRRWMGASCLFISGILLLTTALTTDKWAAVALLALGFAVLDCMLPTAWALCLDIGGRHAGAISGAMNSAGQLGGLICTVLFGYIVGNGGRYDTGLAVIGVMVIVSSSLFAMIDPTRPIIVVETPSTVEI
jgi:predicted MFS family arabinose efflux permease